MGRAPPASSEALRARLFSDPLTSRRGSVVATSPQSGFLSDSVSWLLVQPRALVLGSYHYLVQLIKQIIEQIHAHVRWYNLPLARSYLHRKVPLRGVVGLKSRGRRKLKRRTKTSVSLLYYTVASWSTSYYGSLKTFGLSIHFV